MMLHPTIAAPSGGPGKVRHSVAIMGNPTRTSDHLARVWRLHGIDALVLAPAGARERLAAGDVCIVRLDVLPTLDGIEPGLEVAPELERRGVRVLNRPQALLAMHDKLRTAQALDEAGIPTPRSLHVTDATDPALLPLPGVLKPRFGSWGRDVERYATVDERSALLEAARRRGWWRRHGALAQELVDGHAEDLRIVIAGGHVIGSASRIARPGEWRTNVSLGADLVPREAPPEAVELALAAVDAVGADVAGVDLLRGSAGWVVLELNGAVDFDLRYAVHGEDLPVRVAAALALPADLTRPTRSEETMPKQMQGEPARPGDVIEITGHAVGDAPRLAEIVEVLGDAGHEHFRVRWEDGHESIFFPGEDARIVRPSRPRGKRAAR
jgi:[lysine-biosynthesis-protein LysW]--L-2-aminoadipate ligase